MMIWFIGIAAAVMLLLNALPLFVVVRPVDAVSAAADAIAHLPTIYKALTTIPSPRAL